MPRISSASELKKLREGILSGRDPDRPSIAICSGMGCHSLSNGRIISAFEEVIAKKGMKDKVDIRPTGCHGYCEKGPIVVIHPEEICYVEVAPEDVPEIVSQTVLGKKVIDRLIYSNPDSGDKASHQSEIPFYKNQMRHLIGNNSRIDPRSIDDYLAVGGYSALSKSLLEMNPEQVLEQPGCFLTPL
ncbi:NAD(P)H-dependent oxidoreductase subunit E [Acidobacteriota bacterium]